MKLIWHIFLKDLRRLALPILLWGALVILQFLAFAYFQATNPNDDAPGFAVDMFLWGLQLAAAWLLVPVFIQDDSLLSDRAAWRTRPISGVRLLAAKLIGFVTMFCVWPALLTLPWWFHLGFGAGEMLRVMAVSALGMAAFTGLAAVVAVLTETIVRFLAWSFVVVFACGIALFTVSAEFATLTGGLGTMAVLLTRASLAAAIVWTGAVTVVLLQFLTRRFRLAIAVAGATAIVAGVVVWQWPWSAAEMLARTGLARFALPVAKTRLSGVTLFVPPEGKGRKATLELTTEFACADLRAADVMEWRQLDGMLRHGATGRLPFTANLQFIGRWQTDDNPMELAVTQGRGDVRGPATVQARGRIDLPAAIAPRLRSGPAIFRGDYEGALWHGQRDMTMPFRAGEGGGGFDAVHLRTIRPEPLEGEAGAEWIETTDLFTPEAALEMLGKNGRIPGKQKMLTVRGGGQAMSFESRRERDPVIRIGLLAVTFRNSNDNHFTDGNRDGVYRMARFPDATLIGSTGRVIVPLAAEVAAAPLLPDVVVEGDVDVAIRRAKAEGKLVLVMAHGRDYDPAAQAEPRAWTEPQVRELLRTRYVCAQVFGKDDPRFARHYVESRWPTFVVLTADGREQDAFSEPWRDDWWLLALTGNAKGETYVAQLRAELARSGGNDRGLLRRLGEMLLARGETEEAVTYLLQLAEREPAQTGSYLSWDAPWGLDGLSWRLRELAKTSEPVKAAFRQRHAAAIVQLRADPRDVVAARRLYFATLALKDPQMWADFPRLLPRENPARLSLMSGWLVILSPAEESMVRADAVDWENLFREGRAWVQQRLAEAKASRRLTPQDYAALVNRYRARLVGVGRLGVKLTAAAGQGERARRLALEVLQVDSARWTRSTLARALEGHVDAKALHEIDPLGNH